MGFSASKAFVGRIHTGPGQEASSEPGTSLIIGTGLAGSVMEPTWPDHLQNEKTSVDLLRFGGWGGFWGSNHLLRRWLEP